MAAVERLARAVPKHLTHARPNIAAPEAARDGYFTQVGLPSATFRDDSTHGADLLAAVRWLACHRGHRGRSAIALSFSARDKRAESLLQRVASLPRGDNLPTAQP